MKNEMNQNNENNNYELPEWFQEKKIIEADFCRWFLQQHPMKCLNGCFYTAGGFTEDASVKRMIYEHIRDLGLSGLSRRVDQLLQALKLEAYVNQLPVHTDRIPVLNGTLYLEGTFTDEVEICLNRLQVHYNPDAPLPVTWFNFLNDLLDYDDQLTMQEYMGYCMIPCTKAQQMVFLIGSGGEGKSRIGLVLKKLFGDSMNISSLHKIETNKFARADLENKLLMVDDDLRMSALPSTNYIKTIVTAEEATDIERKGLQSVQRFLYARLLCLGNGSPSALYDKSKGFYRRQIIITTKERPDERVDDPFLIEKMTAELDGIFLWCYEGLRRLIANNYRFTISDRAKENLRDAEESGNNLTVFLFSEDYIRFEENASATTADVYRGYMVWCRDNAEKPVAQRTLATFLKQNAVTYHIRPDNNVFNRDGKRVRGFRGLRVAAPVGDFDGFVPFHGPSPFDEE